VPEENDSSWFSQKFHRVRRSINRFFGADDEQEKERELQLQRRRNREARQKELRRQQKEIQSREKQLRMERQLEKQRLAKRANHVVFNRLTDPRKRASDLYDENEASGYHEEETTICKSTLLTLNGLAELLTQIITTRILQDTP